MPSLTCKGFEFILKVERLLAERGQIHREFRADGVLLYTSAYLEDFIRHSGGCRTFEPDSNKKKRLIE